MGADLASAADAVLPRAAGAAAIVAAPVVPAFSTRATRRARHFAGKPAHELGRVGLGDARLHLLFAALEIAIGGERDRAAARRERAAPAPHLRRRCERAHAGV